MTNLDLSELVEAIAQRTAELLAAQAPAGLAGYLDVDDAASYLACSRQRIYDLVSAGRVVAHRDGRRLLFRPADLDAALAPPESITPERAERSHSVPTLSSKPDSNGHREATDGRANRGSSRP
jgi:excisionase family DNA binding protein